MSLSPTTKLQAINVMLSSISEAPVTKLNSGLVEADLAETILDDTSRDVQSGGFAFNTELNTKFNPNSAKEIALPANTLRADTTLRFDNLDAIQRGLRMFDRKNKTYIFTQPLYIDLIKMLDYTDLPEVVKRYIFLRASRIFLDRVVASESMRSMSQQDEIRALYALQDYEAEMQDYSIFNNFDTYSIIDRSSQKRVRNGSY